MNATFSTPQPGNLGTTESRPVTTVPPGQNLHTTVPGFEQYGAACMAGTPLSQNLAFVQPNNPPLAPEYAVP